MKIDSIFWDNEYEKDKLGWDIGYVSTPLKEYFDQLKAGITRILIPGAGNAHEAEYLHNKGFENVYIVEWVKTAVNNLLQRYPAFPEANIFIEDFFKHNRKYDLIIEQTFFCSLHPSRRQDYAEKVYDLLSPGGKLVGVLFDDKLNDDRPPFGGNKKEYEKYFRPYFEFKVFETAYNSILPRAGRELFINFVKR